MAPKLDPAIVIALSLDPTTSSIASHGRSGFSSTFKLTSQDSNGSQKSYFIKTGKGKESETMFAGEHTSLNAIHHIVPSLCPRSYTHGALSESNGFFLATDFLDLSPSRSSAQTSGQTLAQKLGKLHSTSAPTPHGYDQPVFGFPVPTCCGNIEQNNSYNPSWADFYANSRLRSVLRAGEKNNGRDPELGRLVDTTASKVVPALLGDDHLKSPNGERIKPVVVHGDLWSGNHGRGAIDGEGVEEIVFDPSASYSHGEFEFGIMRMFGGFGTAFERDYYKGKGGRDEPVDQWEDRIKLYELYHHLNHYAIFGGGYRSGAIGIMRELIGKYGNEESKGGS